MRYEVTFYCTGRSPYDRVSWLFGTTKDWTRKDHIDAPTDDDAYKRARALRRSLRDDFTDLELQSIKRLETIVEPDAQSI